MPKLAANLSMMFQEHAFIDRYAAAAQAGFTGVECLFPYDEPAERIAAMLRTHDLEQVLFNMPCGDWAAGERGLACLPDRREAFATGLETAIAHATALGAPRLHMMAGIAPADVTPDRLMRTYVANARLAADALAAHGIALMIEPINTTDMPGYYLSRSDQAMDLLTRIDRPNARLQFDLYHMEIMEGDLTGGLRRLIDHIGHVQIADVPGRHEPGSGRIPYRALFDLLDELGYGGWIGCEYRPAAGTGDGLGWARDWLRS